MSVKNICLVLRKDHIKNPIQASINLWAIKNKVPVFDIGSDVSKFDYAIVYHNKAIGTNAKNTIWWMCDLRPAYIWEKKKFHSIYLCNTEHIEDYKKRFSCPVYYLPQCGDDRPIEKEGRLFDSDVVFIGNFSSVYHQGRHEEINDVIKSGIDVSVISGENYSDDTKYIYKHAPFSLAISPQAEGYTSNRLYNILSARGFCITKYFPGIEDLFENKKHLVWYNEPKEVKDIVNYYYDNLEEYEKIKENGKDEYERKHTAEQRLRTILSNIGEDLS